MLKIVLLATASLLLGACSSLTIQTDALLSRERSVKNSAMVEGVPFVQQATAQCGPATLTMAMNFAGNPVDVKTLAGEFFDAEKKGSLQNDLISSSRRHGMMAVAFRGLDPLLREVQDGHPVVIFENLGIEWFPFWHYAIVFGYDLDKKEIVMHSGPDANLRMDLREFELSWKYADYWGLVILPPGRIAVSAGEFANFEAAAALEQLGNSRAAEKSYQAILSRWPASLGAMIGLGNIYYARKNYPQAIAILRKATKAHPESASAWHNLAIAEGAARMVPQARTSAARAIGLVSSDEKPEYVKDLKAYE